MLIISIFYLVHLQKLPYNYCKSIYHFYSLELICCGTKKYQYFSFCINNSYIIWHEWWQTQKKIDTYKMIILVMEREIVHIHTICHNILWQLDKLLGYKCYNTHGIYNCENNFGSVSVPSKCPICYPIILQFLSIFKLSMVEKNQKFFFCFYYRKVNFFYY